MKRIIALFCFLFISLFADARTCGKGCVGTQTSTMIVATGYGWQVPNNVACTGRPPQGTRVSYAVAVRNRSNGVTVIVETGTCNPDDMDC